MKLARYIGGGVQIEEAPEPTLPTGGLIVQTEACGLCSGELVAWYMDRKPGGHVLGHEVAGRVVASEDDRFPVGSRIFPHHHAPCGQCSSCREGREVHCGTWKSTKLHPGGMADRFAVAPENLLDTHVVDDLRARDAALIEPLACVEKSLRLAGPVREGVRAVVIGLGVMGQMHLHALKARGIDAVGYDLNPQRVEWTRVHRLDAETPPSHPEREADLVIVCPGAQRPADLGFSLLKPEGTLVMFAPMPPGEPLQVPEGSYFLDHRIVHAYSAGPQDTAAAIASLRAGVLRAEDVVERFTDLEGLPDAYNLMRSGEILKAMVEFGSNEGASPQ